MKQTLRLGTVSGIPVGLNWGLLAVAGLYLVSLATTVLPNSVPDAATGAYWAAGAVAVALFFMSVLAHEIGHAVVAQREGIRVKAITLWLLGGVAELQDEASSPGAEFRIAAAGPAVSLLLGGAFIGGAYGAAAVIGSGLASTTLGWLGVINILLAIFNLVPAAPLDGGRILAAALWKRSGSPYRARANAARAGQVFGFVVVAVGSLLLFSSGNIFVLILGWFLLAAATSERQRAQLFAVAQTTSVGAAMAPLASPTDGAVTLAGLLAMTGSPVDRIAFPVRGPGGAIIGVVPGHSLQRVSGKRATERADQAMLGWSKFVSARASESLDAVLTRFRDADTTHAIVYDDADRQVGYIGVQELLRARDPQPPAPQPVAV